MLVEQYAGSMAAEINSSNAIYGNITENMSQYNDKGERKWLDSLQHWFLIWQNSKNLFCTNSWKLCELKKDKKITNVSSLVY